MKDLASRTRTSARSLAAAEGGQRTQALEELIRLLTANEKRILEANKKDVAEAARTGLDAPLLARLKLSQAKLDGLRDGLRQLIEQGDPVGRPLRKTLLDDGLTLTQVTSPLGVLLIIFESRPDAVIQIGGLAIRTGNGLILKGGKEALHSNAILTDCIRAALEKAGLSPDAVNGVVQREAVHALLQCDEDIDLVIPRGSASLVRSIQSSSRIPVMGHADGICHVFFDKHADPVMAERIIIDSKCDYPAACNAAESLLVHRDFLPHIRRIGETLTANGVTLRAGPQASEHLTQCEPAGEEDGAIEYGNLTLSIRAVANLDEALDRIHQYGSGHTESIVTDCDSTAAAFLARVDSASVFHNASTRFADGYRYGLGAEVGISTGRIHARGPVGSEGLLTTRWLLRGSGDTVSTYSGANARSFIHTRLPLD